MLHPSFSFYYSIVGDLLHYNLIRHTWLFFPTELHVSFDGDDFQEIPLRSEAEVASSVPLGPEYRHSLRLREFLSDYIEGRFVVVL